VNQLMSLRCADTEEACTSAFKRFRAAEEVSLPDTRSTQWDHVPPPCGLRVHSLELGNAASTPPQPIGVFSWSDEPEGNQSDRWGVCTFPRAPACG
jgi:hypothetical protein